LANQYVKTTLHPRIPQTVPFLTTNGAEIHYEVAGEGAPVLFLHGLGSSALDWEHQIAAFSGRYRTIAVSARGSGQSRDLRKPSGPFTVQEFAADALAVLEHLGATPAHIVGLSMGGVIAFEIAVTRPAAVRTLTIVNSAPAFVVKGLKAEATIWLRRIIARLFGPRGMAKMLAPKLFPGDANEPLRRQFIERMATNKRGAYISTQLAVLGWSVIDKLAQIAVPTLVMSAEHDYPFLANKQAWASRMPRSEYVEIPGAHHALPIEMPAPFNAALDAFLSRHGAER
jgi:pimeloyl-ACP methyl ester carboxylesterase